MKEQQTYREEMLQGPCGAEPTDSWSTATCDSKKGTTVNLLVHLLLVGLLLLSAVGTNANETAWARVLSTYVNDAGQVDFTSLSNSTADLNKYIKFIGNIGPESHPARFISRGLPWPITSTLTTPCPCMRSSVKTSRSRSAVLTNINFLVLSNIGLLGKK